ncbi:MAG: carbon starvation protein A, partial [Planctomycetota bacterium]|nr:carbon starvation protein A [Planctomycetota bacterium]
MSPAIVTLLCFAAYAAGYFLYARHLARRVFVLDPDAPTPAHTLRDGFDYVPAKKFVLFGHHYASIAGLSPMLGPAIAVIWGWLPALLWVVLGSLFIGAVHDFSALVVSMRAKGMSIGKVAEDLVGRRAMTLFHLIIFFLICLGMGVFVHVVAKLFSIEMADGVRTATSHPEAVFPTFTLMIIAVVSGYLIYKRKVPILPLTVVAFALVIGAMVLGLRLPVPDLPATAWKWILLGYCFIASSLPVWLLLQPRDYINSFLLYLGLGAAFVGLFILNPEFAAPARHAAEGSPSMFPFVFIVIACGAISGFHGLVSSGTTAKQIDKETDARFIGYGGMIGESLLGLIAVLACTTAAGFATTAEWEGAYASWKSAAGLEAKIGNFITGTGVFVSSISDSISLDMAKAFMSLIVVSFALTSLDSATRLLRFNLAEMADTMRFPLLKQPLFGSAVAVAS